MYNITNLGIIMSVAIPTYQEIETYMNKSKDNVVLLKDMVTDAFSSDNPLDVSRYSIRHTPFLLKDKTHGIFIVNIDTLQKIEDKQNQSEKVLKCYVSFCRYYVESKWNQEKRYTEDIPKSTSWTQGDLFIHIPNDYYNTYTSIKSQMATLVVNKTYYQAKIKVSLRNIPNVTTYSFVENGVSINLTGRLNSVFTTIHTFVSKFDIKNENNELTLVNYVSGLTKLKTSVNNLVKAQPQMDYNLSAVNQFIANLIETLEKVKELIEQLNAFRNITLEIKPRLSTQNYVLKTPMFYGDGITMTQNQITLKPPQTTGLLGGKRRRYRKSRKPRHPVRRNKTYRHKRN